MPSNTIEAVADVRNSTRQPQHLAYRSNREDFERLCASFENARRNYPEETVESTYMLAGKVVRTRIVGRALAAVYRRAYAPRAMPPGEPAIGLTTGSTPDLTVDLWIDLWDEAVTGICYPLPPEEMEDDGAAPEEMSAQEGASQPRWLREHRVEAISWLDFKESRIVGWRMNGARSPIHERSKPLNVLLSYWFYSRQIHILHAGMAARNGRGLLIAGTSGVGKSTTSLNSLVAGLDFLSDDHVAVTPANDGSGAFVAHCIFQSARLFVDDLARFPLLRPHAILSNEPSDPKALLFLAEIFAERVVAQAKISAILLPRLTGQAETKVRQAKRADAMHYMARTSLWTSLGVGRARFEVLTQMLGSAPCYWIDLGYDLTQITPVLEQLLA